MRTREADPETDWSVLLPPVERLIDTHVCTHRLLSSEPLGGGSDITETTSFLRKTFLEQDRGSPLRVPSLPCPSVLSSVAES